MSPALIPLALFLGLIGAIVGVVIWAVLKQKRQQRWLFEGLRARGAVGDANSKKLFFTLASRDFPVEFFAGSKNNPTSLTIKTAAQASGSWTVFKIGSAGRMLENLGIGSRISTNDPVFDADYHIDSDDTEFASTCFADGKRRAAVEALFHSACARIELADGWLSAVWTPFAIKEGMDLAFTSDSLAPLSDLAAGLPPGVPSLNVVSIGKKVFDGFMAAGLIFVFVVIGLLSSLTMWLPGRPLEPWALFADSLKWSLPIGAAILVFLISSLKTKTWLARAVPQMALIVLGLSVEIGYFTWAYLNASLDSSPPARHDAPVITKREYRSRNSHTYYVFLQSWRGRAPEKLQVNWRIYDGVAPRRDCVAITTRAGRLGHEWIVSYEPETSCVPPPR